ncbi:MAG: hypothetical protein OEL76_00545 [Siculibacillus sp.]|nr:hypothetical protein [Siculibacillus sp.]
MRRFSFLLIAAAAMPLLASPLSAAEITEKRALARAVEILKGDPYGDDERQVLANITERRFGPRSATVCGGGASPVWAFRVVVKAARDHDGGPIDGWLVIDGKTGRLVCANLPFLD